MGRNERDENTVITGVTIIPSSGSAAANGTNNVTISNVAPATVGTATISKWLRVVQDGTEYYIPMWT